MLYKMHSYVIEVEEDQVTQDYGVKVIKTVIKELLEVCGEKKLREAYKSVESAEDKDMFIYKWINTLVKSRKTKSYRK